MARPERRSGVRRPKTARSRLWCLLGVSFEGCASAAVVYGGALPGCAGWRLWDTLQRDSARGASLPPRPVPALQMPSPLQILHRGAIESVHKTARPRRRAPAALPGGAGANWREAQPEGTLLCRDRGFLHGWLRLHLLRPSLQALPGTCCASELGCTPPATPPAFLTAPRRSAINCNRAEPHAPFAFRTGQRYYR